MLKMTVNPLAIKNSNIPNRTPLSVDMTINSSTTLPPQANRLPYGISARAGRVYFNESGGRPETGRHQP